MNHSEEALWCVELPDGREFPCPSREIAEFWADDLRERARSNGFLTDMDIKVPAWSGTREHHSMIINKERDFFDGMKEKMDAANADKGKGGKIPPGSTPLVVLHRVLYGTIDKAIALEYLHSHLREDADLADLGRPLKYQYEDTYLNDLAAKVHRQNEKWWTDECGNRIERNKGELLCLIHSEISEAMEGERKDIMDDHLPHRKMAEVELADAVIRIMDYAGAYGYDIGGAIAEKLEYNRTRADHSHEERAKSGGKKF